MSLETNQNPEIPVPQNSNSTISGNSAAPTNPPVIPASPPPLPQKLPSLTSKVLPILIVVCAIIFGSLIFVIIKLAAKKEPEKIVETVIVTPTPSPTPIRNASIISTSSAYLNLEKAANEFTTVLNEFSKDDPMLSPPSLILPLGF